LVSIEHLAGRGKKNFQQKLLKIGKLGHIWFVPNEVSNGRAGALNGWAVKEVEKFSFFSIFKRLLILPY